jgi:3-oxocholest-4-en-26-oyl-CoA dehydrogenase beta subunit
MDYDLNEEQTMIRDSARRFLKERCPSDYIRAMAGDPKGYTDAVWQEMADLGWMGLMIPESYGGSGMDFLHLSVLLREMGYFGLPGPFFSTVVLGGLTILEAGSAAQKEALLPDCAGGRLFMTLAWLEQEGVYTPEGLRTVAENKNGYRLSGTKLFVPQALGADYVICPARTGEKTTDISLFLVKTESPGLGLTPLETLADDHQGEVSLDGVAVSDEDLLGGLNEGWPILKKILLMAAVAKSAEMSGGARRVMEMTVTYVKDRVQFGKPVGAFQAVQQHCSDMLTFAETLQFMTEQAAWRISAGLPFEKEAIMCKAWASDAYRKLVALGHQCIGGMGFMEEFDLQLYFKQAKAAEQFFGDADFHREWLAREMGL